MRHLERLSKSTSQPKTDRTSVRNRVLRYFWLLLLSPALIQGAAWQSSSGRSRLSIDTTLSYGITVRADEQDNHLVAITNGGHSGNINGDDGNLNVDKGHAAYSAAKITQDWDASYNNFGVFARGSFFYDFANMQRRELGPDAHDRAGSEAELLDVFGRAQFSVFEQPLRIRAGKQVVNWGESTFIPNGISVVNPVDLSKLRVPGSEIKEALTPTPMLWVSQGILSNMSVEGFVLTDFQHVKTDPRGTFFSGDDAASDDGNFIYAGSGRRNDQHIPSGMFGVDPAASVYAPRIGDRDAKDSGEAGIAFRLFSPKLNNTEFSFYHTNTHSRIPFISAHKGGVTVDSNPFGCTGATPYVNLPTLGGIPQPICTDKEANYFVEYPENIRLFGLGFTTEGPWGIAIQGEASYRPNQPVQLVTGDLALSAAGLATFITNVGDPLGDAFAAATVPNGTEIQGYRRLEVHQTQISLSKLLGPKLGSDQTTFLGEVGYAHMNIPDGLYFAGPAATLVPGTNPGNGGPVITEPAQGLATKDSWGYRILTRMDFLNCFNTVNISPRASFSHDVKGVSSTFNENTKAIAVGFSTEYRKQWTLDLGYTTYFGGREFSTTTAPAFVPPGQPATSTSSTNPLKDRDFYQATISYAF